MNTILIFVLLGTALCYSCKQSTKSTICQLIMTASIGFVLYTIFAQNEMFSLEITPWKKTCLDNDPSECCCPRGFNGQDVYFEYTNDADRLKCGANKKTAQEMMSQPDTVENFSGGCGCSG